MRITLRNVRQGYGSHDVLKDIAFTADSGEVLAILGPNGSGKSTLIRTICKIMPPISGSVMIDDTDIAAMDRRELAKIIAYVPQGGIPSTFSTVLETVLIGRRPYVEWSYTSNDLRIAAEAMAAMKVDDLADRYVNELSGGQMQRVFIARALAQVPMFYLFDEPTSSLDLRNQLDTMRMMGEVVKTKGSGAMIALHDLNLALRYADKVLVLKDGGIYALGSPEDVINERMVHEVYGVCAEIIESRHGRSVQPYDIDPTDLLHTGNTSSAP